MSWPSDLTNLAIDSWMWCADDVDKMFRNSHEQADFNEALRAFESSGDFIDDKQVSSSNEPTF